jgi:hypothetical protein
MPVMVGVANYVAAIPTTNAVEKLPAGRPHRAQARELGLAIELPQFGGEGKAAKTVNSGSGVLQPRILPKNL